MGLKPITGMGILERYICETCGAKFGADEYKEAVVHGGLPNPDEFFDIPRGFIFSIKVFSRPDCELYIGYNVVLSRNKIPEKLTHEPLYCVLDTLLFGLEHGSGEFGLEHGSGDIGGVCYGTQSSEEIIRELLDSDDTSLLSPKELEEFKKSDGMRAITRDYGLKPEELVITTSELEKILVKGVEA